MLESRGRELRCAAGHHFDQAKQGYWPLLQPQDRRSINCGDSDESVLARQRWLDRGYMDGLIDTVRPWVDNAGPELQTLDLGCGEGSFSRSLLEETAGTYCGIDLSKRALKLAARSWPEATWVLANADRILPAADDSTDRVISFFGRRPIAEIQRVLVRGGICLVAVPGEDDLIELRGRVQHTADRRSRWKAVADEMCACGFDCLEQDNWRHTVVLQGEAIRDAMAMSYRAFRNAERERLEAIEELQVTLSADLLLLRKT